MTIGDRVLEINGVKSQDFKNEKHANDLFDVLMLGVIPDEDESEEESEEEESE